MLTREVEAGSRKCHAYLPPTVGASVPYGVLFVVPASDIHKALAPALRVHVIYV